MKIISKSIFTLLLSVIFVACGTVGGIFGGISGALTAAGTADAC